MKNLTEEVDANATENGAYIQDGLKTVGLKESKRINNLLQAKALSLSGLTP
jgi:hypothetical protein